MYALLLSIALATAGEVEVQAAAHDGTWTGAGVDWHSTYVVSGTAPARLSLAVPLPADARVGGAGVRAVHDAAGQVVALDLDNATGTVEVHADQRGGDGLFPPLASGDTVQRVLLRGARFDPDPSLGLEKRVRYLRHPDVQRRERRAVDRAVGRRARPRDQAIYLVADDRVAGGLRGSVQGGSGVRPGVAAFVGGCFLAMLALMASVHRLLGRAARRERAEAYIRTELGTGGSGAPT